MIRFFYETIAQTGWTLLALFVLGYWAWWEVSHFMASLYKNSRAYQLEEMNERGCEGGRDLEMILPSVKRATVGERFFITKVLMEWIDKLMGIEKGLRSGVIRSYERVLYSELAWVMAGVGRRLVGLRGAGLEESSERMAGTYTESGSDEGEEGSSYLGSAAPSLLQARMYACVYKYEQVVREHYRRLRTLRMIATVAPLLGLLGTVVGMIDTFEVISIFGNSNPIFLADGISKALLTTQAGLILSFPLLFMYVFSRRRLQELERRLQRIFEYFTHQIEHATRH